MAVRKDHNRHPIIPGDPYEKLPWPTSGATRGEMYLDVDADMARDFLAHTKGNRRIRDEYVDELVREMRSGNYSVIARGKPFKFDADGYLRDGHHTAFAVIEACEGDEDGTVEGLDSVPAGVVWGLSEEEVRQLDLNKVRTYKDILDVTIVSDAGPMATMTRASIAWDKGYRTDRGHYRPTVKEMDERRERDQEILLEAINMAKPILHRKGHKGIYSPAAMRFHLYILLRMGADPEKVREWARLLEDDSNLWLTRNVLGTITEAKTARYRNSPYVRYGYQLGLLNEAWNRYQAGNSRSAISLGTLTVKINSRDSYPVPEVA